MKTSMENLSRRLNRAMNVYFEESKSFDAEARDAWAKIPLPTMAEELATMEAYVGEGKIRLMKVEQDGKRIGVFGYAVCDYPEGRTLFISGISIEGVDDRHVMNTVCGCIGALAEREGCEWMRCETPRAGLFYTLSGIGFKPASVELVAKTDESVKLFKERVGKHG